MATDINTEANFYEFQGLVFAENETEGAAEGEDHGEAGGQDDGHEAGTEVAHGEEHGATGMPQLDTSTYSNQIFWLVLCLIAVYVIFRSIAIPRIGGTIAQRSQTIQRDLDRAAEMKLKAEQTEEQYNQALIDARAKAHEIADQNKAKIQAEINAATAKADAEIGKQSQASAKRIAELQKEADASVEDIATDVAKSILDSLAPSASDDKSIKAAVAKVLKG